MQNRSFGHLQDKVDSCTKENCQATVDPKQDTHRAKQPSSRLAVGKTVLSDIQKDGADTNNGRRYD